MVEEVEKSLHEMKCPLVPQLGFWVLHHGLALII